MKETTVLETSADPVVEKVGQDLLASGSATIPQVRAVKALWSIHRARRATDVEFAKLLKPFGLTQSSHRILRTLHSTEGKRMPMNELSKQLGITSAAVAIQTNWLEKRGWVIRAPHPTDRRVIYAQLTNEGEGWIDGIQPEMHRLSEELCGDLSEEEQSLLIALLGRLTVRVEARSMNRTVAEAETIAS